MDCHLPVSSVHGIFQARLLEWAAISQIRHNYTYTTSFLSLSVLPLSHPSKLSQRAKLGTLCYIATSHLLSISHSSIYIRRRQWHPTPGLLPGKSHGQRSLVGCSPWGRKESETTERLHFHFSLSCMGEGNGNPLQCSCLENPRDGEPGRRPSMESHRVRHDWSDLAAVYIFRCYFLHLSHSFLPRLCPCHTVKQSHSFVFTQWSSKLISMQNLHINV